MATQGCAWWSQNRDFSESLRHNRGSCSCHVAPPIGTLCAKAQACPKPNLVTSQANAKSRRVRPPKSCLDLCSLRRRNRESKELRKNWRKQLGAAEPLSLAFEVHLLQTPSQSPHNHPSVAANAWPAPDFSTQNTQHHANTDLDSKPTYNLYCILQLRHEDIRQDLTRTSLPRRPRSFSTTTLCVPPCAKKEQRPHNCGLLLTYGNMQRVA